MEMRLLPIVVIGVASLLGLKALDTLARAPDLAVSSAQAATPAPAAPPPGATPPGQRPAEAAPPRGAPSSADALNERLAERRRQLDDREREMAQREALLQAAERRMEERVQELRRLETSVNEGVQRRQDQENQQIRGLIVMYETMKPQEAARIFDRLDMEVVIALATRMNPRRMAEVLAVMQPEPAQRLTVELARRSGAPLGPSQRTAATPAGAPAQPDAAAPRELPRIGERR